MRKLWNTRGLPAAQLYQLNCRSFPRALVRPSKEKEAAGDASTKSIKGRLEEAQSTREQIRKEQEEDVMRDVGEAVVRADPDFGFGEQRVHDSQYAEYAPYSKFVLPIDRVPEDI